MLELVFMNLQAIIQDYPPALAQTLTLILYLSLTWGLILDINANLHTGLHAYCIAVGMFILHTHFY